ncbi:hypothetical protein [Ruminococcus sp. HUN007]|uniref:hypothetical protein n=1 Tax=Ruminococcus sp. HUN007 TaxID=1514668 RepID=UPI0005D13F2C|nr:hypothetical protein [Ruminococcus sp. HUN007]
MNNVLKKISAIAMAMTLIAAGTAIDKNNNSVALQNTVHAVANPSCPNHNQHIELVATVTTPNYTETETKYYIEDWVRFETTYYNTVKIYRCRVCNQTFNKVTKHKVKTKMIIL